MPTYLLGLAFLTAIVVPPAVAAYRLGRRLLPGWSGASALTVDVVLWLAQVVVIPEALGTFGLFNRFAVAGTLCLEALAVAWWAGASTAAVRTPAAPTPAPVTADRAARSTRAQAAAAAAVCLVFSFPWAAWIWASLRSGIYSYDSLAYHLPFAARWIQTSSTWQINHLAPGTVVPYHPATAELIDALTMLAFHSVLAVPLVNVLWMGLIAVSAFAIGQPANRGPHCVALAVVAANCPMLLGTQPGSAMNDLALVAIALAAVAIALRAPLDARTAVPLGLALGLVAGTKLDGLAFVAVTFIGCVALSPREERAGVAVGLLVPGVITGGYFYVRNAVAVGSPVPGVHLPFLAQVRAPLDNALSQSVLTYLRHPAILRHDLPAAFRVDLGQAWPLWLAVCLAGGVLALVFGPTQTHRILAVAAFATIAAWAATPTSAGGPAGQPTLLAYNLRYASVGFVVGFALLATAPRLSSPRWGWAIVGVTAVLAATSLRSTMAWPGFEGYTAAHGWKQTSVGLVLPVLAVILAGMWSARGHGHPRSLTITGVAAGFVGVAAVLQVVRSRDLSHYFTAASSPLAPELGWSTALHHQRIGTVTVEVVFPLYGDDLSNAVQAVGTDKSGHDYAAPSSCLQLRSEADTGHYRYVVVSADYRGRAEPTAAGWLDGAAGATTVFHQGDADVFELTRALGTDGCT